MRFKLDENSDVRLVPLLAAGGHDVDAVRAEPGRVRVYDPRYEAEL